MKCGVPYKTESNNLKTNDIPIGLSFTLSYLANVSILIFHYWYRCIHSIYNGCSFCVVTHCFSSILYPRVGIVAVAILFLVPEVTKFGREGGAKQTPSYRLMLELAN